MKYFSCQPDSHNAFVSFSNCTLSYFSVDSPHYRSLASAASASAPSTPASSPLSFPPSAQGNGKGALPGAAGGLGSAHAGLSPLHGEDRFFPSAPGGTSAGSAGFFTASDASPFTSAAHAADVAGPSTWNRNMSSTRLHIQHVVTLPECFHSPSACFGIANHSLFGVDMTVLGTSTGLLALVIPRERTVIFAHGKDPAGVRDARQRVRRAAAAAVANTSSAPSFSVIGGAGAGAGVETASSPPASAAAAAAAAAASHLVLEVPTTITWMRDKSVVLVGYNTGLVEWYEVRVLPAKARDFLDPNMETPYGPALPANALMQYINSPTACPIEHVYKDGFGDGVWLECTASYLIPNSGPLTSSDHFPATGHCVMSSERCVYVVSATQPGAPLCQLPFNGADFLYCHPCLPFIATLTYSWNAKRSATQSTSSSSPTSTSSPPSMRSSSAQGKRLQSSTTASFGGSQRRAGSPASRATPDAAAASAEAMMGALRGNDCVLHVYEFIERTAPTPVSPPLTASGTAPAAGPHESSAAADDVEGQAPTSATTGPRVAFRVDGDEASDREREGGAPRRRPRGSQRAPRHQLVPVLQRVMHAALPRYGAYFSLSWKFSFDLELAVCNAEEGWVRVLRLAKRAVGVQRMPPLSPLLPMTESGSAFAHHHHRPYSPHDHNRRYPQDACEDDSQGAVAPLDIHTLADSSLGPLPGLQVHSNTVAGAGAGATNAHQLFPYVVVHEHRLRLPLHSLINIEYVSAATSALEASSLSTARGGATTTTTGGAGTNTNASLAGPNPTSGFDSNTAALTNEAQDAVGTDMSVLAQTLGAVTQLTMPTDSARNQHHHHHATLFAHASLEERGPRSTLQARGNRWLQSMRGDHRRDRQVKLRATSAAAVQGSATPLRHPRTVSPFQGPSLPSSALLLKENVLAVQLLQPTLHARRSHASRSRTSSHRHSYTRGSSRGAASSVGTSVHGGIGPSLSNVSAAAIATLHTLLRVGAGRFSTCVGMNMAGEIAVVPVDREASLTWHDEGSVFAGLGSTLCAADIVTIQGVERHMKRRVEKGFGISAKSSLTSLRSVAAAHRNADMEVLCSYVDLMEKAGLAAGFGPVPSIEELVAWPTRPSLNVLLRQQCLPAYAVRQLQSSPYASDTRRLLLLNVLRWLPCSARMTDGQDPARGSGGGGGKGPGGTGSRGLPEWWCGSDVRVNSQSTSVDVERAAAVEVLHGRLREGARLLLDYQSLDVTFTAMATLLSSPDDTLAALQNSDHRVRDAFLRSLSPWMLVMLLYVCSGVQLRDTTATAADKGEATTTTSAGPGPRPKDGDSRRGGGNTEDQNSLLEMVRGYRVRVLRHQGIPLWDRIAIAAVLEPNTSSLVHAFRTHIVPDCNHLQALLLEHGISHGSYPHMQEIVDCTGNFQLAACFYARIGAVSKAATQLAAAAARTCTAWKLSGTQPASGAESDDDDEPQHTHEHEHDDEHKPDKTAATTTTTAGTGIDSVTDADDVGKAVLVSEGHTPSAVTIASDEKEGGLHEESATVGSATDANPQQQQQQQQQQHQHRGSTLTPIVTAGNTSSSGSRPIARAAVPGTPRSPAYDPYVTFSPTLARTRRLSYSATSTPLLRLAGSGTAAVPTFDTPNGTGSALGSRQLSEDPFNTRRESSDAVASAAITASASSPSPGLERLHRLLQRSQLPALAPELCDFGSPLAPMTIDMNFPENSIAPTAAATSATAVASSDAVKRPSTGAGLGTAVAANAAAAAAGNTAVLPTCPDDALAPSAPNTRAPSAIVSVPPSSLRGGPRGATPAESGDVTPSRADTAHKTSATATTTTAHRNASFPANGGGTGSSSSGNSGSAVSPSARRAAALRELIFGISASPALAAATTVNPASFSNNSFTRASYGAPSASGLGTNAAGTGGAHGNGDAESGTDSFNPWLWWAEAYRSFLDSEQAFVKRTSFDIDCHRLAHLAEDAVAAATSAAELAAWPHVGRASAGTNNLAKSRARRRAAEIPTSIVVVADGTGLRQPLEQQKLQNGGKSGATAAAAVAAAASSVVIVAPTSAEFVQRCVCGEHHFLTSQPLRMLLHGMTAGLAHCSVCAEAIKAVPARSMHTAPAASTGAKEGETTTALGWCTACMHGGHTNHLRSWFMAHKRCPVDGCSCHCNEESNLF